MIRELDRLAERQESGGARIFYSALRKQYESAARFIEAGGSVAELAIDPRPIKEALVKFNINVQTQSAKWQYLQLRKYNPVKAGIGTGTLNGWLQQIQAWVLMNSGDHITKITDTTLDLIRTIVYKGVEEGAGAREIGRMIRQQSKEPFSVYRATVIARTEATRSASQGHKIGAQSWEKETGQAKWKEWSATNDSRTRDSHRAMLQLHIIHGEDKFIVGGVAMEFPGDPAGGAKNCVNCRCRIYYMSERMTRKLLGQQEAILSRRIPKNLDDYEKQAGIKVDRRIFEYLAKQTPMKNEDGGAFFDPRINEVNLPYRKFGDWKNESVLYHEYGHAIDWHHGIRFMPDVKTIMDKFRSKFSENNNGLFKHLDKIVYDGGFKAYMGKEADKMHQFAALDDTVMSLNYNFGRGHSVQYFQIPERSEAEFIAHAFENRFIGNPVFESLAPDLYKDMIKMIDDILTKLK